MTYRERGLRKTERLRGWADGRDAKATAALNSARARAELIPFGQPILAGHHSERRDRSYRDGISRSFDRGFEHQAKAEAMRSRADGIEAAAEHAIYSDDPDATERLAERIAGLEAERDRIKAYNATCRKGSPDLTLLGDHQRAGLASAQRVGMGGKGGAFPGYALTNLSGNIARQRKRLEGLAS